MNFWRSLKHTIDGFWLDILNLIDCIDVSWPGSRQKELSPNSSDFRREEYIISRSSSIVFGDTHTHYISLDSLLLFLLAWFHPILCIAWWFPILRNIRFGSFSCLKLCNVEIGWISPNIPLYIHNIGITVLLKPPLNPNTSLFNPIIWTPIKSPFNATRIQFSLSLWFAHCQMGTTSWLQLLPAPASRMALPRNGMYHEDPWRML